MSTDNVDVLELSDEEFMKLDGPPVADAPGTADAAVDETAAAETSEEKENDTDDAATDEDTDTGEAADDTVKSEDVPDTKDDAATDTDKTEPTKKTEQTVDFEKEYNKLTAPFKANGVDIQVKDTDEIIALMQMGANYHKKMASLKPSLKIMKLLERNELLDETKLSYLIDLSKKDKAAITKLIQDSGIDPLEFDTAAAATYVPKTQRISDVEMDLEAVLESIQASPVYPQTLKVVSETWDDASRNVIASTPRIIAVLNEQIENGTFAIVSGEVERARRFGKLQGISDLDAYKAMGDYLQNAGKIGPAAKPARVNAPNPAQKKVQDDKLKDQKKAATITAGKVVSTKKTAPNSVLAMSDDEFNKLPASAYTQIK